jgi:hypothetical protein
MRDVISVSLRPDLAAGLRAISEESGVPMSRLISRWVEHDLLADDDEPEPRPPRVIRRRGDQ